MKLIGIIDDNDSSLTLVTLYKVFKNFYKTEFLLSYKNAFKKNKFSTLKEYLLNLSNNTTEIVIINLKSQDLSSSDVSSVKFDVLIFLSVKRYFELHFTHPECLVYDYENFSKQEFIKNYDSPKYSYGISYNADVFPSSIEEEFTSSKMMICINKNISTLSNNNIVAQEFLLKMNNSDESKIYNILASLIIFILFDLGIPTILNSLDFIFKEESIHA